MRFAAGETGSSVGEDVVLMEVSRMALRSGSEDGMVFEQDDDILESSESPSKTGVSSDAPLDTAS